jgi:aminoglycoside phosphotransferase (APT) family kinase protein
MTQQTSIRPHKINNDHIAQIWAAHGLGIVKTVTSPAGGVRNECYIVNEELVLRVNTLDPQFPKFSNEAAAYRLLEDSPLRVPRVVVLDESRHIVPYDFIIVTRLPGASVAESQSRLEPSEIHALAREAGSSLALLHAFTFEGFGKLRELGRLPFSSWNRYFENYAHRYMGPAQEHGLVDRATLSRLDSALQRAQGLLSQVAQGTLVHSDYHYENILQENGRLTGILDFEWALIGDPASDFVPAMERERVLPGAENAFLEGYLAVRQLDPGHSQRIELYQLFLQIETIVTCHVHGDVDGVDPALAKMLHMLDNIERW